MGWSSDLSIQMHNEALENDPGYRAEYESYLADLDAALLESEFDETEIDWFSDRRLDHTGYTENDCGLCGKICDEMDGWTFHQECEEQLRRDISDDDIPF